MNRCAPTLSVVALFSLLGSSGCELPQDTSNGGSSSTDVGEPTTGSFSFIRIVDESGAAPTEQPGADIDAIVIYADGETFISAGCLESSLFGENREVHGDNPFLDPAKGTLGFKENSPGYGFVSLGGGTLFCELPVAIGAGDRVDIFEIEEDKADSYRVILAEDPADGATADLGSHTGSASILIP